MEQYEMIRTAHRVYGKSIRELSREYGHHRKTIRKIIAGREPEYRRQKSVLNPVMDPVSEMVVSWLREDRKRPKKQKHTARRIYHRLVEEHGFTGAESTVRSFVKKAKMQLGISIQEAMVPLLIPMDGTAEVDWGKARAVINGSEQTVSYFCIRSRYSGKMFVKAYPSERQEMFFDAHISAFEFFGGVFPVIVYDNLSTAVESVLKGRSRLEKERFTSFRSYYTFKAEYCGRARGNEKGGVEGLVGFARRNFMVPLPEANSFKELNTMLLERCMKDSRRKIEGRAETLSIAERHESEKTLLLPLPETSYENIRLISSRVSHYQTVMVDHNRYSVPTAYVGYPVQIHLECWRIRIYAGNKNIASHSRLFGKSKWSLNPLHYLELIGRKIRAFDHARPLQEWRLNWPDSYESMLKKLVERKGETRGKREFVKILQLHNEYSAVKVENAIQSALTLQVFSYDTVRHLLISRQSRSKQLPPLPDNLFPELSNITAEHTDVNQYALLLTGGRS